MLSLLNEPILAILPGSRNQEINVKLPIMLEAAKAFPNHQLIIAGAPNKDEAFYQEVAKGTGVRILENQTYDLLNNSDLAIVTSGTATLETALFHVPQVVCYKASPISYAIGKRVVKIKYISLVNLILDRLVVTELIQHDLTPENIIKELKAIETHQSEVSVKMEKSYKELEEKLGGGGASQKVASLLIDKINA